MGQGDLHDNDVHGIAPFVNLGGEYQHTNAVISDGGGAWPSIRHNTLLNPTPIDRAPPRPSAVAADTAPVSNTVVDGNWLAVAVPTACTPGGAGSARHRGHRQRLLRAVPQELAGPTAPWPTGTPPARATSGRGNRTSACAALAEPPSS